MPEVLIVQPSCPHYRRKLFESVSGRLDIRLICSDVSLDGAATDLEGCALAVTIVRCTNLPGRTAWQSGVVSAVVRSRPKILVINGNPRYLSSIAGALIARLLGIRLVWWGHAMSSTSAPWRAFLRMQMMRLADRIFVYYPEEIARLPQRLHDRAIGIDNAVDTQKSLAVFGTLAEHELHEFRAARGLAGRTILVMIGRLTGKACTGLVLDALASLTGRGGTGLHLVIIGTGPEESSLRKRTEELSLTDRVTFAGAIRDEREIGLWLRSAALFVYGGAVGLSLIHAFCYALPAIIRSPLSLHSPEAVLFEDGKHGLLFEAGNAHSLAGAISRALRNPEALREMGANAQQLVRQRLSIEKMADNFVRGLADAGTALSLRN